MTIDVTYDGGDNNDGIAIFDVTEPGSPRYALLFPPNTDMRSEEVHEDTILNASEYMLAYQGEESIRSD